MRHYTSLDKRYFISASLEELHKRFSLHAYMRTSKVIKFFQFGWFSYYDLLNTPSACGGVSTRKKGMGGNTIIRRSRSCCTLAWPCSTGYSNWSSPIYWRRRHSQQKIFYRSGDKLVVLFSHSYSSSKSEYYRGARRVRGRSPSSITAYRTSQNSHCKFWIAIRNLENS